MFIVTDPPVAGIDDTGEKLTVAPPGCPEADSEIGELIVPVTVALILTPPELPLATVIEVGLALSEKSPLPLEVTVSVTVVVAVVLPEVPVTVIG